jgi:hypothetical protein
MPSPEREKQWQALLSDAESAPERAPSSLKSRLYTALVHKQLESGPLASVEVSEAAGHSLCVFEKLVQIAPVGAPAKSSFFCQVCHARILAEHFENPPIYWPNCPYVRFKL